MRVWGTALFGAFLLALAGGLPAQAAGRGAALDLGDGYQFELIGAGETQARVGNPKALFINVALIDEKIHAAPARLIEGADRIFESVVLGAAEKGYFRRATVNIRKPGGATFEDFVYVRGSNEVWLRQAGTPAWKVAQDAKYAPAPSTKIEIPEHGTFAVESAIEIPPPEGFRRAAEIDFMTKTSLVDIQRKYQEIKALWSRMDRAKMRTDGFDLVLFGNFAEAQRGRFHARKGFFVRIPRAGDEDWPELPDRAPEDRDVLISKNFGASPDAMATRITQVFYAGGGDTIRLADVAAPDLGAHTDAISRIGFGPATPTLKLEANALALILPVTLAQPCRPIDEAKPHASPTSSPTRRPDECAP